jgi:hypothetical protein
MNEYSIDFKYQNITGQSSDILRLQTSFNKRNEPWYIINVLPSKLSIFIKRLGDFKLTFLTDIFPHKVLKYNPGDFREGDKIYTFFQKDGKYIPFTEGYKIILQSKTIKIGAVTYLGGGGISGSNPGYFDIEGIWLANRLRIPLNVYYQGNLVVQLYGYDGMDYMGGSASEVYFDNNRQGLNYLDTLEFKYALDGPSGKTLFKVIIDDTKIKKMFIGMISSTDESPFPDNSVYRIDEPNYTALTYFTPIGDGKSLMSNPDSPFYS